LEIGCWCPTGTGFGVRSGFRTIKSGCNKSISGFGSSALLLVKIFENAIEEDPQNEWIQRMREYLGLSDVSITKRMSAKWIVGYFDNLNGVLARERLRFRGEDLVRRFYSKLEHIPAT
jgi:hypothetical protein